LTFLKRTHNFGVMADIRKIVAVVVAIAGLFVITVTSTADTNDAQNFAATMTPITPTTHIDLFNGKDLTGWAFWTKTDLKPEQIWTVQGGLLECAAEPTSYMRTLQSYENYKLTVVWRFVKITAKSNNIGFLIHMQLPDQLRPVCIKCQGQHDNQGGFWLYHGFTCDQYKGPKTLQNVHIPRPDDSNENPVGQWNTFVLVCSGGDVKFYVNGKLSNELTGCRPSSGSIGIQTEGGQIEVSKIYIEPLTK